MGSKGIALSGMAAFRAVVVGVFFIFAAVGCEESQKAPAAVIEHVDTDRHISTVVYSQLRDPDVKAVSEFSVGQLPAVRIQGCVGEKAHFTVLGLSDGRLVRVGEVDISKNRVSYWPLMGLAPGKYLAKLRVPKSIHSETWEFTVVGEEKSEPQVDSN